MTQKLSTFFLSLMCCGAVAAQSSYFNTVNQKAKEEVADTINVEQETKKDEVKDTKSFLASLSVTELDYITKKYINDHFSSNLKGTLSDSARNKNHDGNDVVLKMYDGELHPLTVSSLLSVMEEADISNKLFVLAQSLLETGYFRSNACRNYNNLFGLTNPHTHKLYHFSDWESSVVAYKKFVQYKYKGGSYLSFLRKIGYAEDPSYVSKVVGIARQINKAYNFVD